ncbi:BMP-binding endothelial regulator protein-like isoform X1 [Branchiostoma lanceolatum]|uniref:BMP-binding endothelial regulator protein-like isoform X1 n=1 Tax=Branchiostoma lanceolatum TaxID=7740 RepID=UPI003453D20B
MWSLRSAMDAPARPLPTGVAVPALGLLRAASLLAAVVLCIVSPVGRTQLISGSIATCRNEGEPVIIPLIAFDPCISCICLNQEVTCRKERCPRLDDCSLVVKKRGVCCEQCKGCTFQGQVYNSGDKWTSEQDPCAQYACQEGVVTVSQVQCYTACSNPVTVPGQCCPVCKGCLLEGRTYPDGQTFTSQRDKCVSCTCQEGNVQCKKPVCPVLSCPQTLAWTPPGECCPECRGQRKVFDLASGSCLFRSDLLDNGDAVKVDACTTCTCKVSPPPQESTMVCSKMTCPVKLDCDEYEPRGEGVCCPVCKAREPVEQYRTCEMQGLTYQHGESFLDDTCTMCTCTNGTLYCQIEVCDNNVACPDGHSLKKFEGECCPRCIETPGVCTVFGDPHYRSFDGKLFNFQGTCKYILSQDCKGEVYSVIVNNDARKTRSFAWTRRVHFKIKGVDVILGQHLTVRVNGKDVSLPHTQPNVLTVLIAGYLVKVITEIGIELTWDGDSFLEVSVPRMYRGKLCGLCGNFNGHGRDDFIGSDGLFRFNVNEFADSWRVGEENNCNRPSKNQIPSPCANNVYMKLRAHKQCKLFRSRLFSRCSRVVKFDSYYRSCVTDMCECPSNKNCFCESVRAYTSECRRKGVELDLSSLTACQDTKCTGGAVWDTCGPACPLTCANLNSVERCNRPCVPGCQCPAGMVRHHHMCVYPSQCPRSLR